LKYTDTFAAATLPLAAGLMEGHFDAEGVESFGYGPDSVLLPGSLLTAIVTG